ncbi:conserved protein of unknown function [Tenacibaculum sp. 190524A02b]|uniref:helix-turn-helix domain-containing protein n=1 Tax=Tenacibaculum vairaonense TaxID=3137860 RepID=UPI0032B284C2
MNKGQRLKYIIKESGFTNKSFAENIEVSANYISMLIKERQDISGNFLLKLKRLIPTVNLDWLESGEGEPFIQEDLNKIIKNNSSIEVDKVVDIIIDNYDKFINNEKFKIILETYSNKKLMEYLKNKS